MKRYTYKAKTKDGKTLIGLVEGLNEKDVLKTLREKNLLTLSLVEKGKDSVYIWFSGFQGVSPKDVCDFTRQLATMINAGLSLTNCLSILKEQAKSSMSKILIEVIKDIEGGSSLHDALAKHPKSFSKIYLSLIKSGEASGALDEVMQRMADSLEKSEEFKNKVKGALIYPAIVMMGMVIVGFIMMVFVLPKLMEMYKDFGTTLPLSTQILIAVSTFMSKFWYLCIAVVVFIIYSFQTWRQTVFGRRKFDEFVLKLPVFGVLKKKIILTEISRTLSMLLNAGVTIIEALNIVAEASDNAVFEESIARASSDVEKGLALTSTFERYEEYPPIFTQMVAVGEETGKLDEVLMRLSKQFEMESETAVKGLTTAIEPLMMIILGVGVGFLVFSIITPIYNLTSKF